MIQTILRTGFVKLMHPAIKLKGINSVRLGTEINICKGGRITLGKNVMTNKRVTFSAVGGDLAIGDCVSFNRNVIVVCRQSIEIGSYTSFGPNTVIYDHDHQISDSGYEGNQYKCSPVVIGSHCWIGANVIILRGSVIGEGCVIGANTVIKGDIPAYSLVKGAREISIEALRKV